MLSRRTKITFEGLNLNRTLNKLAQEYTLFDVVRQGKVCQITVETRCVKQVVAYLREKCYNVQNTEKIGGSFVALFLKKHYLVPLFLILAVAAIALSSNFCWNIEVVGDYDKAEVLQALEQCDVRVGTALFAFRTDSLENKLATQLDAMYAVVNRKGSVLYVNAVKKKQADEPVDMHKRRDIVATVGGKVTYLLCEQGTAMVKVGDTVQKGDILIVGVRTFNDGTTENVYSLGKVRVEPSCSAFAKFTGKAYETVDTGKTYTADAVELFGKEYGKLPPFETFRTERTESKLFPLNLTVAHVVYYETQQIVKTVTIDECLDDLKKQALDEALHKANFEVKYTQYSVTAQGVTATVYGEIEMN